MMMSMKKNKKLNYCVISENYVAQKLNSGSKTTITLILGSLVHVHSSINETHVAIKIVNYEFYNYDTTEDSLWSCPVSKLLPVNEILWPLISAVVSPIDRVNILKNPSLCEELSTIEVGSLVLHRHWDSNEQPEIAVVKYKGPISKLGPGTFFGIELLESESASNNDGSFAGQSYFHCPVGTGKFVPVNELRLSRSFSPTPPEPKAPTSQMVSRNVSNHMFKSTAVLQLEDNANHLSCNHEISRSSNVLETDKVLLKPGDHVIWISDSGPQRGIVRWCPRQDNKHQMKVGVSFDDVGDRGDEKEIRLLELPVLELVKAEDFYGNSLEIKKPVKVRTKSDSSSGSCKDPVSKLRRSDSFRWNSSTSQENSGQNEKSKQDDVVDFLTPDFSNRLSLGVTSNGKPTRLNNDLINISSSPTSNSEDAVLSVSSESDGSYYDTPEPITPVLPTDFDVGSVVEVLVHEEPHYGVIRWIGYVHGDKKPRKVAGIEMEEEHSWCSDGTFNGRRYFQCNPQRAFFVSLSQCRKDSRFQETHPPPIEPKLKEFGQVDCPVIPGIVQPLCRDGDIEALCGKYRGIQGHHNSCYLDATLFSMFTFTSVFDSLLFRPATEADITDYEEVQRVLREEIVNPLRENLYVRADRVMKLRTLLEKLSSVTGLTSEEKDPEEFLTSLVAQILRAEPFLKLSSGQETYHYQLFVEKDEQLTLPTVQHLFEQSFLTSDIKLKEVPSCLIIQMPRFGKSYKMYPRILPSQLLDVTDIIENSPRQCTVCGKLAEYECKQCFDQGIHDEGLQSISFCGRCLDTAHSHQRRAKHTWRQLHVPAEFSVLQEHCVIPRLFMELFAVVCIETSHYVAFVKCGTGSDAPWCFFDSMADRKGEQNGYNIPEMVQCPNLPYWLSEKGAQMLHQVKDDRQLPEHAKRLLCDAYMCMYQSSEVMMYR